MQALRKQQFNLVTDGLLEQSKKVADIAPRKVYSIHVRSGSVSDMQIDYAQHREPGTYRAGAGRS
jgi:hypothetical protein